LGSGTRGSAGIGRVSEIAGRIAAMGMVTIALVGFFSRF